MDVIHNLRCVSPPPIHAIVGGRTTRIVCTLGIVCTLAGCSALHGPARWNWSTVTSENAERIRCPSTR